MPLYEFMCANEHLHEALLPYAERNHVRSCPICHEDAHKIMSTCSFVLKGAGFYKNDYPKKGETHE